MVQTTPKIAKAATVISSTFFGVSFSSLNWMIHRCSREWPVFAGVSVARLLAVEPPELVVGATGGSGETISADDEVASDDPASDIVVVVVAAGVDRVATVPPGAASDGGGGAELATALNGIVAVVMALEDTVGNRVSAGILLD